MRFCRGANGLSAALWKALSFMNYFREWSFCNYLIIMTLPDIRRVSLFDGVVYPGGIILRFYVIYTIKVISIFDLFVS